MNRKVIIKLVAISLGYVFIVSSLGGTIYKVSNINQQLMGNTETIKNDNTTIIKNMGDEINVLRNTTLNQEKLIKELQDKATTSELEKEENNKILNLIKSNNTSLGEQQIGDIAKAVTLFSSKYDISKEELLSIIKIESNFNPNLLGSANDSGLMQLIPSTYKDIATHLGTDDYDVFNIYTNIEMGAYYISNLKSQYGKYTYIVYNQGLTKPLNNNTYNVNTNSSTSYISRVNKCTQQFKEELE